MQRTLHLPEMTTVADDGTTASFVIEPLYRGFGVTVGNSLRRVLMSTLEGAAVTAFAVEGASHEFTALDGVTEDVVQVTLNLKRLRFRVFSDDVQEVTISKKGKGPVTGADIQVSADVEVLNPEQIIATLDNSKASLSMTLRVEKGRGYVPVEGRHEDLEVGMIAIDALFSPVRRVRYKVSHTRVGQVTGLDKLVIDLVTDGSVTPTMAMQQAAAILAEQFAMIAGEEHARLVGQEGNAEGEEPDELSFSVEDLNLSPRTTNA
ncbi:DNA-directed RNA polymerase subunit alpha, partial [Candidatus Microgenomates bacterium]|nr:DNA-directed RNA polymerase subunit alpha [Candidatus Microgenomates bacterium]